MDATARTFRYLDDEEQARAEARRSGEGEARNENARVFCGSALRLVGLSGCVRRRSRKTCSSGWRSRGAQVQAERAADPEPKKFTPQAYTEAQRRRALQHAEADAGAAARLGQPSTSGLIAPELKRRKEAARGFPAGVDGDGRQLNAMASRSRWSRSTSCCTRCGSGNYLGQNYGRITRITETELGLREIVQDAAGEWIERVATLQLQERSK